MTNAVSPAGDSSRHVPQELDIVMDLLPQSCQPDSICVSLCHSWATWVNDLCSSIADRRQYTPSYSLVCCSTEREWLSDQGKPWQESRGKRAREKKTQVLYKGYGQEAAVDEEWNVWGKAQQDVNDPNLLILASYDTDTNAKKYHYSVFLRAKIGISIVSYSTFNHQKRPNNYCRNTKNKWLTDTTG